MLLLVPPKIRNFLFPEKFIKSMVKFDRPVNCVVMVEFSRVYGSNC